MTTLERAAGWLRGAADGGDPIDLLTPLPALDLDGGYALSERVIAERRAAGELLVGAAVCALGRTIPPTLPVDEPSYRWLTDAMHIDAGTAVQWSGVRHPLVRPEVAFIIDRDLDDPATTAADVRAACDVVLPALVVIDRRLRQPTVRPGDIVAICTATSRFTLGQEGAELDAVDLSRTTCTLRRNGEEVATAAELELPGTPADAVAWLVRTLAARGAGLESGMVVLSGGFTHSVPLAAGDAITAEFAGIGDVGLCCV